MDEVIDRLFIVDLLFVRIFLWLQLPTMLCEVVCIRGVRKTEILIGFCY